jgi:nitrate reductase NapD
VNISSVILRARPEKLPGVRNDLAMIPGVEIHADGNDGRLILTIEDGAGYAPPDVFLKLHELDGVISASLVYQYCDDGLPQEADK